MRDGLFGVARYMQYPLSVSILNLSIVNFEGSLGKFGGVHCL